MALTNNLVQCCYLDLFTSYYGTPFQLNFYSYNNLFQGGTLSLNYGYTYGTWAITDNLFDTVMVSLTQYDETPLSASYNAYKSTTSLGGSNNKTLTTCDYQTGTLGSFY